MSFAPPSRPKAKASAGLGQRAKQDSIDFQPDDTSAKLLRDDSAAVPSSTSTPLGTKSNGKKKSGSKSPTRGVPNASKYSGGYGQTRAASPSARRYASPGSNVSNDSRGSNSEQELLVGRGTTPPRTGSRMAAMKPVSTNKESGDRKSIIALMLEQTTSPPQTDLEPEPEPESRFSKLGTNTASSPRSPSLSRMSSARTSKSWKMAGLKVKMINTMRSFKDDANYSKNFNRRRRNGICDVNSGITDENRWELEMRWGKDSMLGEKPDPTDLDFDPMSPRPREQSQLLLTATSASARGKLMRSLGWTFASFPFSLVFHLGNFSHKFDPTSKWPNRLQVFASMLIYVFPAVLMFGIPGEPSPSFLTLMTLGYIVWNLFPVAYVAYRDMTLSFKKNSIVMTGFLFRPAVVCRLSLDNITASFGYLFEGLQHCQIACPADYFGFVTKVGKNTTDVDTNASSWGELAAPQEEGIVDMGLRMYQEYYELFFWASFATVVASNIVMLLRFTLRGPWNYKLRNGGIFAFLIWAYGMYFVHGPLYLTIQKFLFQGLVCDYDTVPATLRANPNIECWDNHHRLMAALGLMGVGWYAVIAILLPATSYLETTQADLDIIFVPVYLQTMFLIKTLILIVLIFFGHQDSIKVPVVFALNLGMLILNNKMNPCCVHAVNVCRSASFSAASWIGLVGMLYLYRTSSLTSNDECNEGLTSNDSCSLWSADISNSSVMFINCGLLIIGVQMVASLRAQTKTAHHAAASTFIDFEHLDQENGNDASRHLEPYLALCTSPCGEHNDVAAEYHTKLVKLLDQHPSQHVRFEAAWAIFVLSWHPENRRQFIDERDSGGSLLQRTVKKVIKTRKAEDSAPVAIPSLLRQAVSGHMQLQLKCLAAIVNLSAVDSDKRVSILLKYGVHKMVNRCMESDFKTAAQFCVMAIANLARHARCRPMIMQSTGMKKLITLLKSRNPLLQKAVCTALSNMCCLRQAADLAICAQDANLKPDAVLREDRDPFESEETGENDHGMREMKRIEALKRRVIYHRGFLPQVIRIANVQNGETLTEVVTLLANLACYEHLRPALIAFGVDKILAKYQRSNISESTKHAIMISFNNLQDREEIRKRVVARFKRAKAKICGVKLLFKLLSAKRVEEDEEIKSPPRTSSPISRDIPFDEDSMLPENDLVVYVNPRDKTLKMWRKLRTWGRIAGALEIERRRKIGNGLDGIVYRKFAEKHLGHIDFWPRLSQDWLLEIRGELERQKLMDAIISSIRIKTCKRGEMIFRQGESAYSGYYNLIYKGQVLVIVDKRVTRRLHAGACFGEVALFESDRKKCKRSATVVAVDEVTLMLVDAELFREKVLKYRHDDSFNCLTKTDRTQEQDNERIGQIVREVRDLDKLRRREPITMRAVVDWAAWGSKLDRFTVDSIMDFYAHDQSLPQSSIIGPM